jgi:hypothetical protein
MTSENLIFRSGPSEPTGIWISAFPDMLCNQWLAYGDAFAIEVSGLIEVYPLRWWQLPPAERFSVPGTLTVPGFLLLD